MDDAVDAAMQRFDVPPGHEDFLFLVPAFLVAESDGKISFKEAMSIMWNALRDGLIPGRGEEKQAFDAYFRETLVRFRGTPDVEGLEVLAAGINARLARYPDDKAARIRGAVKDLCVNVAKASGPLFRDHVSAEERAMLDKIFEAI